MLFFRHPTMLMKTSKLHVASHDIIENKWLREDARCQGRRESGPRTIGSLHCLLVTRHFALATTLMT